MVTRQKYTRFATLANWSAIQAASAVVGLVSKHKIQLTIYCLVRAAIQASNPEIKFIDLAVQAILQNPT